MSRWPRRDEPDPVVAVLQFLHDHQTGTSGVGGNRPRVQGGVGILIDVPSAGVAVGAQFIEVSALVHSSELQSRRGVCRHHNEITAEIKILDRGHRCFDAARSFRMFGGFVPRIVKEFVDNEDHGSGHPWLIPMWRDGRATRRINRKRHGKFLVSARRHDGETGMLEYRNHRTIVDKGDGAEVRDAPDPRSLSELVQQEMTQAQVLEIVTNNECHFPGGRRGQSFVASNGDDVAANLDHERQSIDVVDPSEMAHFLLREAGV